MCGKMVRNEDSEEEPCFSEVIVESESFSHEDVKDNKIMVNTALPDRPSTQSVVLSIAEHDRHPAAQQETSLLRRLKARLRAPNVIDVCIAIVVCAVMGLIELGVVPHTRLGFTCRDPSISYPFRGDTVSGTTLMTTAFFGPLFLIVLVEVLRERSLKRICVGTVWGYYRECVVGAALVLLIVEVIKVIVGEQRPHFFDSCEPDANRFCQPGAFILEYNCTNERLSNYFKTDITRSFPSGHSAISMFVALYCSYIVHVRVPTAATSRLTKPFLMSLCLSWSLVCSLSRITDRRHHWWDVLAGICLGVCGALYTLHLMRGRERREEGANLLRSNTSTTTLLDVKNKDATSVII